MNLTVDKYNDAQIEKDRLICLSLMVAIKQGLPTATSKIWHGSPVWFVEENPIVGYCKLKNCIQLLFWSGASFDENLEPVGKFKAAQICYTTDKEIDLVLLSRWLEKAVEIQWDYKNIVKRQGELVRLK